MTTIVRRRRRHGSARDDPDSHGATADQRPSTTATDVADYAMPVISSSIVRRSATRMGPVMNSSSRIPALIQVGALYDQLRKRAIDLQIALEETREIAARQEITLAEFHAAAKPITRAAFGGGWLQAVTLWRLVLEAIDHSQPSVRQALDPSACSVWMIVAGNVLTLRADAKLLGDAQKRSEIMIGRFEVDANPVSAAHFRHQLGVLLLDPYIHTRSPGQIDRRDFEVHVRRWIEDGRDHPLDLGLADAPPMPSIVEALTAAVEQLQHAAHDRQGRDRGLSLKALVGAIYWLGVAQNKLDRSRIASLANEATTLLDAQNDAEALIWLQAYLSSLRDPRDNPRLRSDSEISIESSTERLLAELAQALDREDSALQLQLIWGLANIEATRKQLRKDIPGGHTSSRVTLFGRIVDMFSRRRDRPVNWSFKATCILQRAENEGWSEHDLTFAAIWFGQRCSEVSEEPAGIELLTSVLGRSADGHPMLRYVLELSRAVLRLNYGRTCLDADRLGEAFSTYMLAADNFCRLDLLVKGREAFDRANDMFDRLGTPYTKELIGTLAVCSPMIEAALTSVLVRLREMWQSVLSDVIFTSHQFDFVILAQVSKAALMPFWRMTQSRNSVLEHPSVRAALDAWKAKVASLPPSEARLERESIPDLEALLTAYHDEGDKAGRTAAEQLFNLQRAFDRTLTRELSKGVAESTAFHLSLPRLQAALTDRSVLMTLVSCRTPEGAIGCLTLLITRTDVKVFITGSSVSMGILNLDGLLLDWLGTNVSDFRGRLLGEQSLDSQSLQVLSEYVFGPVNSELKRLHGEGYSHLCINPFGALHYCPLALLQLADRNVGLDWTVTHLPALAMLVPRTPTDQTCLRSGGAAIGVTFQGQTKDLHRQALLPSVASEITTIASYGCMTALLDACATPSALNAALKEKRYVHIATHGAQNPAAPSFQELYLYPTEDHDGIYYAFEVLAQSLDGLDLVTLSACETALGRVDVGDNIRGLQAYLLCNGTNTVISCLWPVYDDVAHFFFSDLYRRIADGLPKLAAYQNALTQTRLRFPEPHNWGTFQYSGSW